MAWEPSKEAVYKAIDAYECAPGVMQFKAMRAALIAAHDAEQTTALDDIETELKRIRAEIRPAKAYADDYGLKSEPLPSDVHIKLDMIDGYARAALEAVEAHRAKKG